MTLSPSKLLSSSLLSLAFLYSSSALAVLTSVIDSPEQANVGQVTVDGSGSTPTDNTTIITNYVWDFGDGTPVVVLTTAAQPPIHTYDMPGEYKISLTVKEGLLEATSVKYITVLDINSLIAPKASFIIQLNGVTVDPATTIFKTRDDDPQQIITFVSTTFNNMDASNTNNNWDFGDGNSASFNRDVTTVFGTGSGSGSNLNIAASLNNQMHYFTEAGTYTVTLASQRYFPDLNQKALTGTTQVIITVAGITSVEPLTDIAMYYEQKCSGCHGKVVPVTTNGVLTKQVKNSLHSNLAGRGPGTTPMGATLNIITAQLIADAYMSTIPVQPSGLLPADYMSKIDPKLTLATGAVEMEVYLAGLIPFEGIRSGAQVFEDQCSWCHGTGTGGYASSLVAPNMAPLDMEKFITDYIIKEPDMRSLVLTPADLTAVAEYLTVAPIKLIDKPTTGMGLYDMYCNYCHGDNGSGSSFAGEQIMNVGLNAETIRKALEESDDDSRMEKLQFVITPEDRILLQNYLNPGPSAGGMQ